MTFTYDPTDDIGTVRRLIGMTVEAESEISDEEIEAWLTDTGSNAEQAAIKILRQLAARYARKATITSGNEKIEFGNVAANLLAMVKDLEESLGSSGSTIITQRAARR